MPLRKPRSSAVALTGFVTSPFEIGKSFSESSLERDLLRIMKTRCDVISTEVQPIKIEWVDASGQPRSYIPDLRVVYKQDFHDDPGRKYGRPFRRSDQAEVFEVKYFAKLRKYIDKFRPAFQAARAELASRGERFTVLTERTIRTLALDHSHFFNQYRRRHLDSNLEHEIITLLADCDEEVAVGAVIERLSTDSQKQLELFAAVWILVARGQIEVDHSVRPHRQSLIWLAENRFGK
jgi:hypothetical protein